MPVQKSQPKGGLVAKLGQKLIQAHNAAKDQDTDYGNLGDLPSGINGGVAQLVDIKIDVKAEGKKDAGKYYFYAGAVVVTPKVFTDDKGVTSVTEGMRTMITTPLYDTPERSSRKTFADHWGWMLNELRKMGIDTRTLKPDDVEATLEALRNLKPFIRFRTWKGETNQQFPNPRVNHEWGGLAEHDGAVDQIGAVADSTVGAEANGHADVPGEPADPTPPDEATAGIDWEALGAAAEGEDEAAQTELTALAEQNGLTEDDIRGAEDWNALAALVKAAVEGTNGGDAETWKVGDACLYAPKDPRDKTGVKRLKKVQCSIVELTGDGTEATLKNLDDPKKKYKAVSINEIEPA